MKSGVRPCRILAAVSGGTDSTALLFALTELRVEGFDIECAHVNHHLRGADSDEDETFVRELCTRLTVRLHVADGTLDSDAIRRRGIEAAAREVRYARLHELRESCGASFIATAHQKNDQAETVLMRLMSGSGIAGLRGIQPVREDHVLRPLLGLTRDELEAFLRTHDVTPRFDRSNDDSRFLRNRVRALLRELGGIDHLARIATEARSLWPLLEQAIDAADHAEVMPRATRFPALPKDEWLRGAILQRHIRRMDPDARDFDARRIARELGNSTRLRVTKTLELVHDGTWMLRFVEPPRPQQAGFEVTLTPDAPVHLDALRLTFTLARQDSNRDAARVAPSSQRLQLPRGATPSFTIRNRRPGDRFQPLGMSASKTLKDFLIDRKIAAPLRDRLPLLLWNGEIVWVAGVEISERFKVTTAVEGDVYEVRMEGEKRELVPVFSADAIRARVTELGNEIRTDAGDAEVFLLGILKGTSVFLADLLRAVPGEVSYGYIDVVRDAADTDTNALEIDFLSFTDIRGRNVYVLKDVVNTGVIENYLLTQLRMHAPASIRLVALLDRTDARTVDVQTDFRAFTIEDGTFAGYGLEHERRFANCPFIGRVS
ncbi:MAG TPA: tRNA lysidine(34) synthetase TilS [Thermoanaerobaculia bacterium]